MAHQDISDEIREARYEKENEDTIEQFILMIVTGLIAVGAVLYGAHWLDGQFHWHLEAWIRSHLHM